MVHLLKVEHHTSGNIKFEFGTSMILCKLIPLNEPVNRSQSCILKAPHVLIAKQICKCQSMRAPAGLKASSEGEGVSKGSILGFEIVF